MSYRARHLHTETKSPAACRNSAHKGAEYLPFVKFIPNSLVSFLGCFWQPLYTRAHTQHTASARACCPGRASPFPPARARFTRPQRLQKKKKKTIWHGEAWIRSPPRLESTLGNTALSLQKYAGVAFVSVARAVRVTGREIGASINKWMKQNKRLRFSLANPFVNGSTLVIEHLAYIYGPYISSVATILFRGK